MLKVRYSAQFEPSSDNLYYRELALSLVTLQHFVAAYADVSVVLYVKSKHKEKFAKLISLFDFECELVAPEEGPHFAADYQFAQSVTHCEEVDRICIRRMLTDFRDLNINDHRLLLGSDVFFLAIPDDLLQFYWSYSGENRILYMADTTNFRGSPYKLRFFNAPILEGLLGDFYLLAPGVSLAEKSIKQCLRLIDSWPVSQSRYVPGIDYRSTQSEQQAASILLQPFGGKMLAPERYSHSLIGPDSIVVHTHALNDVIPRLPQIVIDRFMVALSAAA